jgi:hypothetical protein
MKVTLIADFFMAAKSFKGKEKVFSKIKEYFSKNTYEISWDNDKTQDQVSIKFFSHYDTWEIAVYNSLEICQSLGREWLITGNLNFEFSAWSNQPGIVGVNSISINVVNPDIYKNNFVTDSRSSKSKELINEVKVNNVTAMIENEDFKIKNDELVFLIDYLKSIISELDKLPKSRYTYNLIEKISSIIQDTHENQDYNLKKFLDFANDFVSLVISIGAMRKYTKEISLLYIINHDADKIYEKFNISYIVGEYFHENWETYVKDESTTINDLIFDYYLVKYLELVNKSVNLKYISNEIKKDKYLSSSNGFYTRQKLIIWLYEKFLSLKKSGISFLEYFRDYDDMIRKKIDRIYSHNLRTANRK